MKALRPGFVSELTLALLLTALPMALYLGEGDFGNDEAIYAFAARGMVETGDWLTPLGIYDGHSAFFEKPPLKFWLAAAGMKLGLPDTPFGHRFVDLLFSTAALAYLVALGRRVGGPWAGALSALAFFAFGTPILSGGLMSAKMESCLALQYAGSLYHLLAWAEGGRSRRHVPALFVLFVLGFMTKFVAALFLPMIVAVMLALEPTLARRVWAERRLWIGWAVGAFAVIAPWFLYQTLHAGKDFWIVILGQHVIKRLAGVLDPNHLEPWSFYAVLTGRMLRSGGSGLALLLGLAVAAVGWRERRLAWLVVGLGYLLPVVAMSAMTSKLPHYLHPFMMPLAIFLGVGVAGAAALAAAPGPRARRAVAGLAATFALIPIGVSWADVFEKMDRPGKPFTVFERCLREENDGRPVLGFFGRLNAATHAYAFYRVIEYRPAAAEAIRTALFGNDPRAIWLSRPQYRELLDGIDSDAASQVVALEWPGAASYGPEGETVRAVLLLPGPARACAATLEAEGATRVDPGAS